MVSDLAGETIGQYELVPSAIPPGTRLLLKLDKDSQLETEADVGNAPGKAATEEMDATVITELGPSDLSHAELAVPLPDRCLGLLPKTECSWKDSAKSTMPDLESVDVDSFSSSTSSAENPGRESQTEEKEVKEAEPELIDWFDGPQNFEQWKKQRQEMYKPKLKNQLPGTWSPHASEYDHCDQSSCLHQARWKW